MKPAPANVNTGPSLPHSDPNQNPIPPVITVAIDGYAGTGKSSTAKEVARQLGFTYIDTGAMYRAVTLYLLEHEIPLEDNTEALLKALSNINLNFRVGKQGLLQIHLNGTCAEPRIRHADVTTAVSQVATLTAVRHKLVEQQRSIGKHGGIVMDGRDIGTYVFPDAELKVFMTASLEVRARRRERELGEKQIGMPFSEILKNLRQRDYIDSHRDMGPLRQAHDAVVIDTTNLSFSDQVEMVVSLAKTAMES